MHESHRITDVYRIPYILPSLPGAAAAAGQVVEGVREERLGHLALARRVLAAAAQLLNDARGGGVEVGAVAPGGCLPHSPRLGLLLDEGGPRERRSRAPARVDVGPVLADPGAVAAVPADAAHAPAHGAGTL